MDMKADGFKTKAIKNKLQEYMSQVEDIKVQDTDRLISIVAKVKVVQEEQHTYMYVKKISDNKNLEKALEKTIEKIKREIIDFNEMNDGANLKNIETFMHKNMFSIIYFINKNEKKEAVQNFRENIKKIVEGEGSLFGFIKDFNNMYDTI